MKQKLPEPSYHVLNVILGLVKHTILHIFDKVTNTVMFLRGATKQKPTKILTQSLVFLFFVTFRKWSTKKIFGFNLVFKQTNKQTKKKIWRCRWELQKPFGALNILKWYLTFIHNTYKIMTWNKQNKYFLSSSKNSNLKIRFFMYR